MSELLVLRAVVGAAPDAVAEVLLDVRPGGRSPLATDGEIEQTHPGGGSSARSGAAGQWDGEFVVVRDGSRLTVSVDRAARSVALQGEWWYRGVTSVEPDPRGSRVVHRVCNVAARHGWAVRFVSRGPLHAAPRAFAGQIRRLGETLGVPARVVD